MYNSLTDSTEGMGGFSLGRDLHGKTPLLGHKNSKMSLKKLHIIIVKWSALLLTTARMQESCKNMRNI